MLNWIYRPFDQLKNKELYDLIVLRNEVFVVEQNCIYQDTDGKDLEGFHLLGYDEDALMAYCRILPNGVSYTNYCSIGRVVVSPKGRRKNFGKELMIKAIELCSRQFAEPIKISAQCYLEKFYTELGFEIISDKYLEDDIPHYAMIYKGK